MDVAAGDRLVFLVNMNENIGFDTTAFDPTIAYEDGETHTASKEFSGEQGKNGWRYQYLEKGKYVDLVYYAPAAKWRRKGSTDTPLVGADSQHPDVGPGRRARLDRAEGGPRAGHRLGLQHGQRRRAIAATAFRPGTATYAPWYALYSQGHGRGPVHRLGLLRPLGVVVRPARDGAVTAQLKVAGHKQTSRRANRSRRRRRSSACSATTSTTPATSASTGSTATCGTTPATAGSRRSACSATG